MLGDQDMEKGRDITLYEKYIRFFIIGIKFTLFDIKFQLSNRCFFFFYHFFMHITYVNIKKSDMYGCYYNHKEQQLNW